VHFLAETDFLSAEDRALLAREFTVANPEEVPNLVDELPPLEGTPEIVAKYHVTDRRRPRLRCAKCGERVHWKGYVLRLPAGKHALLAERHCGRAAFGLNWEQVERAFLQQVSRQSDLVRLEKVRGAFSVFLSEVQSIRSHPQVLAYDKYYNDLRHSFGPLSRGLGKSPKQLGLFNAEVLVRNKEAEYSRAKRQVPDLVEAAEDVSVGPEHRARNQRRLDKWLDQQQPIFKTDIERFGPCLGDAILRDDSPSTLLDDVIKRTGQVQALLDIRNSSDWTAAALTEGFKAINQIVEDVDQVLLTLARFQRFTSRRNMVALAGWATRDHTITGIYRAEGGILVDEVGRRLEPACSSEEIDLPAFEMLQIAFGRESQVAKAA
jgi:hypothetical protein